jgi:hypothetical protein
MPPLSSQQRRERRARFETAAPSGRNFDIPAHVSPSSAQAEPRLSNETHAKGLLCIQR